MCFDLSNGAIFTKSRKSRVGIRVGMQGGRANYDEENQDLWFEHPHRVEFVSLAFRKMLGLQVCFRGVT